MLLVVFRLGDLWNVGCGEAYDPRLGIKDQNYICNSHTALYKIQRAAGAQHSLT